MNKFLVLLIAIFLISSCKKDIDPPLILPPNFNKMPNLQEEENNNDNYQEQKDVKENIAPLKEFLLKK